jgi:hypothetical protein
MAASDSEVLMVFGGRGEKRDFLTSLLIFNPRSERDNCWMELTTKLPRGWASMEAFYNSGSVYLVGGRTDLDTTQGAKKK